MNKILILVGAAALLLIIAANLFLFTVDEREMVIKFQFREIVRDDFTPGLYVKIPFVNTVRKFDKRIQTLDAQPKRFLTVEKKNVIVDSFVKWRIEDVAKFFTANEGGSISSANTRLSQVIMNGLRDEFGKRTIQEAISGERAQIMDIITVQTEASAKELGIKVVDVRIKRIDYAEDISTSVYERMEAERERVAAELRSQGAEAAERIMAEADREATIIKAEAYRDSERLRGEGDATATEVYANSFGQDREFYKFYRSLNAYQSTFDNKGDIMVLEPNSEFFRYFGSKSGK